MSDAPVGPGWWQASDGKWYPPDAIPEPPKVRPFPNPSTSGAGALRSRGQRRAQAVAVVIGLVVVSVAAVGAYLALSKDDGPTLREVAPVPTPPITRYRSPSTAPTPTTPPPRHEQRCPGALVEIRYYVDGTASSGSVTMDVGDGTQQADVDLPMTNREGGVGVVRCGQREDFVYVSVQNRHDSGTVTCTIVVDGATVAENSSSGAYVIATCSGSA